MKRVHFMSYNFYTWYQVKQGIFYLLVATLVADK